MKLINLIITVIIIIVIIKIILITYTLVSTKSKLLIRTITDIIMNIKILRIRIILMTKDMTEIRNNYLYSII